MKERLNWSRLCLGWKSGYRVQRLIALSAMILAFALSLVPFFTSEVQVNLSWRAVDLGALAQIGGYLSGTTGVLVTLASVLYLYVSVRATLDSLEGQQEAMNQQLRSQEIRDFENLFTFLCEDLKRVREGVSDYQKDLDALVHVYGRWSREPGTTEHWDESLELSLASVEPVFSLTALIARLVDDRLARIALSPANEYLEILSARLTQREVVAIQVIERKGRLSPTQVKDLKLLTKGREIASLIRATGPLSMSKELRDQLANRGHKP